MTARGPPKDPFPLRAAAGAHHSQPPAACCLRAVSGWYAAVCASSAWPPTGWPGRRCPTPGSRPAWPAPGARIAEFFCLPRLVPLLGRGGPVARRRARPRSSSCVRRVEVFADGRAGHGLPAVRPRQLDDALHELGDAEPVGQVVVDLGDVQQLLARTVRDRDDVERREGGREAGHPLRQFRRDPGRGQLVEDVLVPIQVGAPQQLGQLVPHLPRRGRRRSSMVSASCSGCGRLFSSQRVPRSTSRRECSRMRV